MNSFPWFARPEKVVKTSEFPGDQLWNFPLAFVLSINQWSSRLLPANKKVPWPFFSDSTPHQHLFITLTLVNKIKPRLELSSTYPQPKTQNQNQNTVLLLWYADSTAKKTQRRQQIGRDPSLYLTALFLASFSFFSFVLLYYKNNWNSNPFTNKGFFFFLENPLQQRETLLRMN